MIDLLLSIVVAYVVIGLLIAILLIPKRSSYLAFLLYVLVWPLVLVFAVRLFRGQGK